MQRNLGKLLSQDLRYTRLRSICIAAASASFNEILTDRIVCGVPAGEFHVQLPVPAAACDFNDLIVGIDLTGNIATEISLICGFVPIVFSFGVSHFVFLLMFSGDLS